jgi:hypothetical protein
MTPECVNADHSQGWHLSIGNKNQIKATSETGSITISRIPLKKANPVCCKQPTVFRISNACVPDLKQLSWLEIIDDISP